MAELRLFKNNEEMMKFQIRKETVSIGRGSQNDICLPDVNISRLHMTITCMDNMYIVTDKSTNGTFINSKRVFSQELKDKDEIKIGTWLVRFFTADEDTFEASTQIIDKDPTRIISYKADKNEIVLEKALLRFEGDKNKIFPVTKSMVAIGKSKANDIVLNDDYVSNFHVKIENRGGQYFVKDLSSTNGTYLNGQRIFETSLPFNSIMEVGKTIFKFYLESETRKITPSKETNFVGIISKNEKMRSLFTLISKISNSDSTVLIQGETGTGKELFARGIYKLSGRNSKPFVTVNCGAISKDLIESELFGHEKGAFTSAFQQRQGAFELASGGTIFLDEIGELPLDLQPKLLRVLENKEIKRVGGNELIDVDARIIAATNKDLAEEVKNGKFREDLFYRLMVIPIFIPPLRERREDVPLLAEHFLTQEISKGKIKAKKIAPETLEVLKREIWNGNVRELKNLLSRVILECDSDVIKPKDLHFPPSSLAEPTAYEFELALHKDTKTVKTLSDVEKDKIHLELKKNGWNRLATARALGISKSTLHEKIKKYDLKIK